MMMIAGAMEIVKETRKMTDHTEAGVIPIIRNLIMTETGHQEETRAGHMMMTAASLCTVTSVITRDIIRVAMMTTGAIQGKGHIMKTNGQVDVVRADLLIRIVEVILKDQIIRVAAREGIAVMTGDLNAQNVIGGQAVRECQTMMTTVNAGTARALMMI